MSRIFKRPFPRHQAPAPGRQSGNRLSGRWAGTALRRVIVTPTFAAGLGIVIAAALVLPMTTTVFRYTLPEPGPQPTTCQQVVCASKGGPGHAADSGGGRRMAVPRPPSRSPAAVSPSPQAAPPTQHRGRRSPASFGYHTVQGWPGGFIGEITITSARGSALRDWQLRFRYPGRQIQAVWGGGTWTPLGEHGAQVTYSRYLGEEPGQPVEVLFKVTGDPRAPVFCRFNRQNCHLG